MERRKFCGSPRSANGSKIAEVETVTGAGRTNKAGAIAAPSESWQQDMEQAVIPGISWPQSMELSEAAEECL